MESLMSSEAFQIVRGMAMGLFYAISGWAKTKDKKSKFDFKKMWPNLMLGAFGGYIAETKGMSVTDGMQDAGVVGFIALVQNVVKSFRK